MRTLAIESKQGGSSGDKLSGILCDKRVPQKLKGKFYRTAIRPAMLYGAECWPTKIRHVQQLSVAEICCCDGFVVTQEWTEFGTMIYVIVLG